MSLTSILKILGWGGWLQARGPESKFLSQAKQAREFLHTNRLQQAKKMEKAILLQPNSHHTSLNLSGTDVEELPAGLTVQFGLVLRECVRLQTLPEGLKAGSLDLRGCSSLTHLPERLDVSFLDISGCTSLEGWPTSVRLEAGRLRMRDCVQFDSLPSWLTRISQLDLAGCVRVSQLPSDLHVSSWIDVADTSLTGLPDHLKNIGIRWRGVRIDYQTAFHPEQLTAMEVLQEPNSEVRRVKMERMGYDRFMEEANAEVLDTDQAPGGERKLLRVEIQNDEPLVGVSVGCPSTGRRYLLRVPPHVTSCRQAVAWTAGFDNPNDYRPILET